MQPAKAAHGAFLARPSWGPRKAGWLCGERRSSVGPNIPAGVVVCENCGHMEFFAMGSLGLLKAEEHDGDGK